MSRTEPLCRFRAPEDWLALASGTLSPADAHLLRSHLRGCDRCQELALAAAQLQAQARRLRVASPDEQVQALLWSALAPVAASAARRAGRRRALDVLLTTPMIRVAAGLFALLIGGVLAAFIALRPGPSAREQCPRTASTPSPDQSSTDPGAPTLSETRRDTASRGPGGTFGHQASAERSAGPQQGSRAGRPLGAAITLRCGGLVTLGGASARVEQDQPDRARVRVTRGQVALDVPKLADGARLEVITQDARVRVVGTRFTVEPGSEGTTVTVLEGVVWVTPTGGASRTLVLRAGDRVTVQGEKARLRGLASRFRQNLASGRLQEAAEAGRQYLALCSAPDLAFVMQLRLAAVLVRLDHGEEAASLYRRVARRAPSPVARQNALALLARLEGRRGRPEASLAAWERLAAEHPDGLYDREALMHLVRARCGRGKTAHLARLRLHAARNASVAALLERCGGPAGPSAGPSPDPSPTPTPGPAPGPGAGSSPAMSPPMALSPDLARPTPKSPEPVRAP